MKRIQSAERRLPSHHLPYLSKVWLDTMCYDSDVLAFALSFCTPDKMVLGTDFPHQISDLELSVERVKRIETLSDEDKEKDSWRKRSKATKFRLEKMSKRENFGCSK